MAVPVRTPPVPAAGDYLTDGKRLVEVLGIDREGRYEAEDVVSEELIKIPVEVLSAWRVVERG